MKKRPRSIQYLLFADRKLRKLSLRRLVARRKTTRNPHRSARPQKTRRLKKPVASPATISTATIVLSVIGIIAAGGFLAARQPARQPGTAIAAPQAAMQAQLLPMPAPDVSEAKKIVPPTPTAVVAVRADPPAPIVSVKPAPEPAEKRKPAPEAGSMTQPEATNLPAKELAAAAPSVASASTVKSDTDEAAVVTVTGCLEGSESGFRLKDTGGVDALKSRSWKTGFLTRRSSSIDLVDAADTLKLPTLVGQRVSATGTLVNREMRARSLQRISPSC